MTHPPQHSRPIEILMIEDNPADVRLTREAFHEGKLHNRLHVVASGEAGLGFLRRHGEFGNAPRPDIVLLDLNLPGLSGREVLAEIKADPVLQSIPVVVLTSSAAEEDILKSYHLHANCYIVKPVDFNKFVEIARQIKDFWFTVVTLPDQDDA